MVKVTIEFVLDLDYTQSTTSKHHSDVWACLNEIHDNPIVKDYRIAQKYVE